MFSRRKWCKDDISNIVQMRRNGMTLNKIGLTFLITGNAVRKALQRHCPMYMKKTPSVHVDPKFLSFQKILEWGVTNSAISDLDIKTKTRVQCAMKVNQYRLEKMLSTFVVDENLILPSYDNFSRSCLNSIS